VDEVEQHARQVSRGRRWWTPFAVHAWVGLGVAIVAAVVIAAALIAYFLSY
jgi:hypothetical protein